MTNIESTKPDDTVFLNSRREAILILVAWFVCMVWSVSHCYLCGYNIPAEEVTIVFGMPSWVFYGVFLPWILATLFSVWFGLFYMSDDDLGETAEDAGSSERENAHV